MFEHVKRVLIIGGSSGIGEALARVMCAAGQQVLTTGIEPDKIAKLNTEHLHGLSAVIFDAASSDATLELKALLSGFGPIDCIVYSAGIGQLNRGQPADIQNRANQVNVLAFTTVADFAWRYFEQQGHGQFVCISSLAGLFGYHKAPAYHAAKSYQINYLESLRQKAFHSGKPIYITDIRPGFVTTGMTEGKKLFWPVSAAQAANIIYRHIERHHDIGYVPGRWWLLAGLLHLLPSWIRKRF
jgi:short-subunit dehydrogenase